MSGMDEGHLMSSAVPAVSEMLMGESFTSSLPDASPTTPAVRLMAGGRP